MELYSSTDDAHMEYGAVVLRVPVKEDIFSFDIFINDEEVLPWRIPMPAASNTVQKIVIDWLVPEEKVDIMLMTVDKFGRRSDPALVSGHASASLSEINVPHAYSPHLYDKIEIKKKLKPFRVWALPEVTKIDPVSGQVLSEPGLENLDRINPVWREDTKEIRLSGVKGEILGFQLCIESENRKYNGLELKLNQLTNSSGDIISADTFSVYLVHYLRIKDKWYPELAIPVINWKLNIDAMKSNIRDQKNQLVYIDLKIPSVLEAGRYRGEIIVTKDGETLESLNISLNVEDLLMPQSLSFIPELNMYAGPGDAGTEKYFSAHRIAHEHRAVINRVPYSQDGKVHLDMIPDISYGENGHIDIDWADYDRRLGPLFDGTLFVSGERKGIPVEKFYLPFFENWPSIINDHYSYPIIKTKTQAAISAHALESRPLEHALTSTYTMRVERVIKEFKKHFEEKEWHQTEFQFYLNNKWHWAGASSWWNLDEPMSYDDWMALKFFGMLFRRSVGPTPVPFIFRADISRPRWQHDWLNDILNRMYVQDKALFRYSDRVRRLKEEGDIDFTVYGSLNGVDESNHQTVLLCMRAFAEGADGILPWQSLGSAAAFTVPDKNALLVDTTNDFGIDWVTSLRLKALRRCQQNVELMHIMEKNGGYKREQTRDLMYRYFNNNENMKKRNAIDSSRTVNVDTFGMENFRKLLISLILKGRET